MKNVTGLALIALLASAALRANDTSAPAAEAQATVEVVSQAATQPRLPLTAEETTAFDEYMNELVKCFRKDATQGTITQSCVEAHGSTPERYLARVDASRALALQKAAVKAALAKQVDASVVVEAPVSATN